MQRTAVLPLPVGARALQTLKRAEAAVCPAWFTSVMGTGILGILAFLSPVRVPFLAAAGRALFATDVALFAAFAALLGARLVRRPATLRESLADVAVAQTWGAPPMACFTVAVGFLRVGPTFFPPGACIALAQTLWVAGVVLSVAVALVVPYAMVTKHELTPETTYGTWLLPVVPPIVASVPAAILLPSWPAALQSSMLALAYALLGTGLILAALLIAIFYSRLLYVKVPPPALVPTTWLVLGPLGQSVAGFIALGSVAPSVWPEFGHALLAAGVAYGLIVWGFAMYWLALAAAVTLRAVRLHLPFTLGWWAFTFPVGTLTSGTYALYATLGAGIFEVAGFALLTLLAIMWALVATRSLAHARASLSSAHAVTSFPSPRLSKGPPAIAQVP